MVTEELASVIVTNGLGTLGTDLFLHVAPNEPDDLVVLVEYAGDDPEYIQETVDVHLEAPRIQVGVRNTSANLARAKAEDIYRALMRIRNESIQGTRYMWCRPVDTPSLVGRDDSNRFLVTVNFRVKKELTNA